MRRRHRPVLGVKRLDLSASKPMAGLGKAHGGTNSQVPSTSTSGTVRRQDLDSTPGRKSVARGRGKRAPGQRHTRLHSKLSIDKYPISTNEAAIAIMSPMMDDHNEDIGEPDLTGAQTRDIDT